MKIDKQKFEKVLARKCMNPPQLAKLAKMPYQTIVRARAGENLKPATLGKIAAALGVDIVELIDE